MDLSIQKAVFRFGIISGVLHENRINKRAYFKKMAQKEFDFPGHGPKKFKWETFKKWLSLYNTKGFDGLVVTGRSDKGKSRKIDNALASQIGQEIEDNDLKTISNLYRHLIKRKLIDYDSFTEATLRNFIKASDLHLEGFEKKERKAFEMPHINMLWTADFMHGPYLSVGKKKKKTYLCVIIDDHSRVLVGASFFFSEGSLSLQLALKEAILTYGIPRKFYCDNGKVFVSGYLHLVCARLGIALIHSKPYDSPSRGKVERVIRTVRLMFLPNINIDSGYTLEQFNRDLKSWVNNEYHQRIHGSTKQKPIDRYINDQPNVKIRNISREEADNLFYHSVYRTVKNDCTVSIANKLYELPARYIGQKVEIRFPLDNPEDLRLFDEEGRQVWKLTPLDKNFNAQHTIRYSEDENEEGDNV